MKFVLFWSAEFFFNLDHTSIENHTEKSYIRKIQNKSEDQKQSKSIMAIDIQNCVIVQTKILKLLKNGMFNTA